MKLHLPQQLLLACLSVGAATQAATGWNGSTLYIGNSSSVGADQSGLSISYDENSTPKKTTITSVNATGKGNIVVVADRDGNDGVQTAGEIGTLSVAASSTVEIGTSTWSSNRVFNSLLIGALEVNGGEAASLKVTHSGHTVQLSSVTGALSSVVNSGTLQLGTEESTITLGGTIANSGHLTLQGTFAIENSASFNWSYTGGNCTYSAGEDGFRTVRAGETIAIHLIELSGGGSLDMSRAVFTYNNETLSYSQSDGLVTFGRTLESDTQEHTVWHVRTQDVVVGGESATSGLNGVTSFAIAGGRKVTLNGTGTAATTEQLLTASTGEGDLVLNTNAGLSGTQATQMTGTLTVGNNALLTLGSGEKNTVDISSFSGVTLDDGRLKYNNRGGSINCLTVAAAGGSIESYDMGDVNTYKLHFSGKTQLNGQLTLSNTYNAQMSFEALSGSGNLVVSGAGRTEALKLTLAVARENGTSLYSGQIRVTGTAHNLQLIVGENEGLDILYQGNDIDAPSGRIHDLTQIGAGNHVTLQGSKGIFKANSDIAAHVTFTNSSDGTKAGYEVAGGDEGNTGTCFSGRVSGSGNFVISSSGTESYTLSGDVSGWTGKLDVAAGTHDIVYSGNSTLVNNVISQRADGAIKLELNHEASARVTKEVTVSELSVHNAQGICFENAVIVFDATTLVENTKAVFAGSASLGRVTLGNGATLRIGAEGAATGALALSNLTSLGEAVVQANLTLSGELSLGGALTLDGNSLSFDTQAGTISLSGAYVNSWLNGDHQDSLVLFENVGTLSGWTGTMNAGSIFRDMDQYQVSYRDNAVILSAVSVPEPSGAMPSLLALAGLCARRRR